MDYGKEMHGNSCRIEIFPHTNVCAVTIVFILVSISVALKKAELICQIICQLVRFVSHFRPRDVLKGILLLFFHKLFVHKHMRKTTFERKYPEE